MRIAGSVFLIGGGASGLGAATARRLVEAGGKVLLADWNAEAGAALAQTLGAAARFVRTDVTQEEDVARAVEVAANELGGLHGVVNCAGVAYAGRIVGRDGPHPLQEFTRVVSVNLIGAFNVARLAAAQMALNPPTAEGERGVIVNTSSIAAYDGQIGQAAYAASKAGIAGMTLPLARDLGKLGIRVMAIAPGLFDTPLLGSLPEDGRRTMGQQTPFPPRLGQPEEFAALVAHIVENPMLNGEVIRLDGALRLAPKWA